MSRVFMIEAVRPPEGGQPWVFRCHPVNFADPDKCPLCSSRVGKNKWLPPYRCEIEVDSLAPHDVLFVGGVGLLVSQRLADACDASGMTGLAGWNPVEVVRLIGPRKRRVTLPPYSFTEIRRSRLGVDDARSGLRRTPTPPPCVECGGGAPLVWNGLVLEATPPEYDIFRLRNWPEWLCSDRFRDMYESMGCSGVEFVPLEDCRGDYSFGKY